MEPNILYTHLTSAALFAYLLSYVQQWSKIPWVTRDTAKVNAALRLVLAFLANAGITWAWSGTWETGRTVLITFPTLAVMAHFVFNLAGQYALQQGGEKVFNIGSRLDPKVLDDVAAAVAAKVAAVPKA